MRNRFSISLIWIAVFALTANTFAQDFTQLDLPEGAKACLDKGTINEIVYSPDSKHLVVTSGSEIWFYDVQTGEELDALIGHTDVVVKIAFSPDGQTLTSGGSDQTVRLWDVATGNEIHTLKGHKHFVISIAFSPDGKTVASGSAWGEGHLRLWEVATGNELQTLTAHKGPIIGIAFSPDGKTLASSGLDSVVLLWELHPDEEPAQLAEDVNKDGVVNILDLTFVASNFGESGENDADVNADGIVNILDLTAVAAAFGNTAD